MSVFDRSVIKELIRKNSLVLAFKSWLSHRLLQSVAEIFCSRNPSQLLRKAKFMDHYTHQLERAVEFQYCSYPPSVLFTTLRSLCRFLTGVAFAQFSVCLLRKQYSVNSVEI